MTRLFKFAALKRATSGAWSRNTEGDGKEQVEPERGLAAEEATGEHDEAGTDDEKPKLIPEPMDERMNGRQERREPGKTLGDCRGEDGCVGGSVEGEKGHGRLRILDVIPALGPDPS